jgi:membrane protein
MKPSSTSILTRIRDFFRHGLWRREPLNPAPLDWVRRLLQMTVMIGEGFVRDQLILRAHALTYFTALSLIPLLAITVALASALGLDGEKLVDFVRERLAVSIPENVETQIVSSIQNVNFGGLGGLGAGFFLLTTILAIGTVEQAFNQIWGVKEQRPWSRRIPDYLAVLLIMPMMMGISSTLAATLRSQAIVQQLLAIPFFETFYETGLRYTPFFLLIAALTFVYWFLPNTSVRLLSALIGGVVAGVFFTWAQSLYVNLNVGVAKYSAFFGGFAFLPLLLVWMYISWAITLLGAEVAFAHQNLAYYSREVRNPPLRAAERDRVGLAIALEIARVFRDGDRPWSDSSLADAIDMPVRTVRSVLHELEGAGIISRLGGGESLARYQLGKPADRITVAQVLESLRGERQPPSRGGPVVKVVSACLERLDLQELEAAGTRSLQDLLRDIPSHAPPRVAPPEIGYWPDPDHPGQDVPRRDV